MGRSVFRPARFFDRIHDGHAPLGRFRAHEIRPGAAAFPIAGWQRYLPRDFVPCGCVFVCVCAQNAGECFSRLPAVSLLIVRDTYNMSRQVGALVARQCDTYVKKHVPEYLENRCENIVLTSKHHACRLLHYFALAPGQKLPDDLDSWYVLHRGEPAPPCELLIRSLCRAASSARVVSQSMSGTVCTGRASILPLLH